LLAVRILATSDHDLIEKMLKFQAQLADTARAKGAAVRDRQ
jgi:5-(carboxyamino)imidazole ribonucleotide mutase